MALLVPFIINQFKAISTMNHQTLYQGRNFLLKATTELTLQLNLRKHEAGHKNLSQSEHFFQLIRQFSRYTRNLVDVGNGKYNLMLLCWGEGHGSAIHDHANAHCFMKMLHGELCETRFEWPEKEIDPDNISEGEEAALKEKGRTILRQNQVCYINDSLGLHRVENVSNSERAVSLHLYCPPFDSCSVFNQRTGHRSTSKVTFWSIYGERRNKKLMEDVEPEDN